MRASASRRFAWLFRLALLAHERTARERFGREMLRIWEDDVDEAWTRGVRHGSVVAMRGIADVMMTGLRERVRSTEVNENDTVARRPGSAGTMMSHLGQDIRFALRSLGRQPAFAAVAIVTLGLGIGATVATFSVVNGVLLRSLPYARSDRLVRIWEMDRRAVGAAEVGSVSPVVFADWQERSHSFEAMAALAQTTPTLTGMGEPEIVSGAAVTSDFFRVFDRDPILGRPIGRDETLPRGPLAVVISQSFWKERFGGNPSAVGGTMMLSGRSYTIVGVAPAGFDYPGNSRIWVGLQNNPDNCGRGCVYTDVVARLADGVTIESAQRELSAISDALTSEFPSSLRNRTAGLDGLQATIVGDVRRALWLLLGAVGMVLLIACANVANLLIARGTSRSDEIAVRTALGAGRKRIVMQLLTESLMLGAAGGALGLALSFGGVRALRMLSADGIPRIDEVGIDGTAMAFAALIALLTAIIFGFAPALQLARTSVAGALRQDATRTTGARRGIGRSALLAGEVGLSLLLLVGAGLLVRSFSAMQRIDPGFAIDGISRFSINLPGSAYPTPQRDIAFFEELASRVSAIPGVSAVSRTIFAPLSGSAYSSSFERTDQPPPEPGNHPSAAMRVVDDQFMPMMGIPILEGRGFEPTDRDGSTRVIIVNRSLADRFFPGENAVGHPISIGVSIGMSEKEPRTIIGVVPDVHTDELMSASGPEFYVPYSQTGPSYATFLVRAAIPHTALISQIRTIVKSLDGNLPVQDAGTMRDLVGAQTARPRFYLFLLSVFAILALTLAAVGLYGVVAYIVAQRRREIGVRMVLGADMSSVVSLVLRQGLVPAAFGAAGGLLAAFAGVRLMQSLLFGVQPVDTLTFVGTTALLLAVVILACLVPAVRATRIPPALALRSER
jgi:putative ABC transport system permease protein